MGELSEWLVIIGLILFGAYTMYAIKNEKNDYLKTALAFEFHGLRFFVPRWWTKTRDDENHKSFERKDTRYDWIAHFEFFIDEERNQLEELFKKKIIELGLIFDPDSGVIYNPSDFKKNKYVEEGLLEIVRIEGTATENEIERVYFDGVLFRNKKTHECVFCSSRSSVLNGGIEGPFFEEAVINFKVISPEVI